jgi:GntR family transcriptional repressor for pyruvate dehydrogenase complex
LSNPSDHKTSAIHQRHKRTALRPVRRQPELVQQVVERLREAIMGGEFPSQSVLPSEGKLAESLGVSYTVVREAMRVLRSQGLVEVSQGRRPRVKPAGPEVVRESLETMLRRTSHSLHELTELRRVLECEIAEQAARRAKAEPIEAMQAAIDDQKASVRLEQQIAADMRFHDLLAQAAGNTLFPLVLASVSGLQWEARRQAFVNVGISHAVEGHQAVLDAVKRRDGPAARRAMLDHMQMIVQDLKLESN